MKALIVLAVLSVVSAVPVPSRDKRSYGHYSSYSPYVYSSYTSVQPSNNYPVYDIPGKTTIHTTSATRYSVHVPVTYSYHYEQPIRRTTTIYNAPTYSAPIYTVPKVYTKVSPVSTYYSEPASVYSHSSYAPSYSASSWHANDW